MARAQHVAWVVLMAACTKPAAPSLPVPQLVSAVDAGPRAAPFEVSLTSTEAAQAIITLETKRGFHLNLEYPTKFTPTPESTVQVGEAARSLSDALVTTPCAEDAKTACRAQASLPLTATDAGPAVLAGTLAFSVCSADLCLIEKVPLRLALSAQESPRALVLP